MSMRLQPRVQRAAITSLVCFGLLLAACTRSATTGTVPTAGPTSGISSTEGVVQPSDQDATMNAIGTQVSAQLTQTAVAAGVGGQDTPAAPGDTPSAPQPTEAGQPTSEPGATPKAPQPTQPAQPATATPIPPIGAPCPNPYTVQTGDWIYKIARNCGVSVSALIAANPGINPNYISPGQLLNMPAQGGPTPGSSAGDPTGSGCSGRHVVVTGETLYRISYTCGLTVEQLAAINGITFPYTIYVGQILTIP
jgi:LysM repeat protein